MQKSIYIFLKQEVSIEDLECNLIEIGESCVFFGMLRRKEILFNPLKGKVEEHPLAHILLNGRDYSLDCYYYPDNNSGEIQLVEFATDRFDFDDDLFLENGSYDLRSKNAIKLIELLKKHLNYYDGAIYAVESDENILNGNDLLKLYNSNELIGPNETYFELMDAPTSGRDKF